MSGSDTIAAIATAPGRASVAVVRVSGPEAAAVGARVSGGGTPGPGRFRLVRVRSCEDGETIDEALMLAFRGPNSYTGEDVVEFQCHGGTVTPRRVLESCLRAGARLARRGEFTERALLNGKLDYDQAESVLDLIDARTDRAADSALRGLSGRRSRELRGFYERALTISTELEHALDVDESDLPPGFLAARQAEIESLRKELSEALHRAREGRILRQGALVVLSGPPNVGKSSLMNALLEENRAIVSATPGTTRDILEEWLDLEGWPVRLADTAGLRTTDDEIEAEGVRRAEALRDRADVALRLVACDQLEEVVDDGALVVYTKSDLLAPAIRLPADALKVSAKTGEGLPELRRRIVGRLEQLAESVDGETDDTEVSRLAEVLALFGEGAPEDDVVLIGNRIRTIAGHLGALVGAVYSADMLERLFSRFCVGK